MTQPDTNDTVGTVGWAPDYGARAPYDVRSDPVYKVLRRMARWWLAGVVVVELAKQASRRG